jgi:hypothetical protein
MAHPYHHALSSAKIRALNWQNHFELHDWLDSSKAMFSDARHRSLFHHTTGVYLSKSIFKDIKNAKEIAQEHIVEDLGTVPSIQDWLPENYWSPKLVPSKNLSLTDLKGSLIFKNPFPKKTQRQIAQCVDILLSPENSQPPASQGLPKRCKTRFFYFSSAGPYLCQKILGPLLDANIPTRTICEYMVQKVWNKIPSHQDIMEYTPIQNWMWTKAKPLSRIL